jgi:hypothetical protein
LLRGEEALRLNCPRLAIGSLSDVENDRVRVQLRRNVAIDWAGGIVLELRDDKPACGLGWMIAADPGLRVVFELVEGNSDAVTVRFADTVVAADKGSERHRFGRGEGRIPSGAVLHRLDGLALCILVFIRRSLPDKLLSGLWMLALAEFCKVLGRDRPDKAELPGQMALPFARDDATLRPIILLLRSELLLVVGLRLACGKWFGDGQHDCLLHLVLGTFMRIFRA